MLPVHAINMEQKFLSADIYLQGHLRIAFLDAPAKAGTLVDFQNAPKTP